MTAWLIVYRDERELDSQRLGLALADEIRRGRVVLLKTGAGKVRAAVEVTMALTGALRTQQARPRVISAGSCVSLRPEVKGLIRAGQVVDRDGETQPKLGLESPDLGWSEVVPSSPGGLVLGSGDSASTNVPWLLYQGVSIVDTETHAVAHASMLCLAGKVFSVRYVVNGRDTQELAREKVTDAVLLLTTPS